MGNCQNKTKFNNFKSDLTFMEINKQFISYNVLDNNKIIIGIWNNSNKLNILGYQGIWFVKYEKIYELKYGISLIAYNLVLLYFENNIVLKIFKDEFNNYNYILCKDKIEYTNIIDEKTIINYKKINNNSQELDLIYLLFKK